MTRTEVIKQIKSLLNIKFDDAPAPAKKADPASATPKKDKKPFQVKTLPDGSPDLVDMSIQIADLRETVAIMGDFVALKDQYEQLKKRLAQIEAGFSQMKQAYTAMQKAQQQTLQLMEQNDPAVVAKEKADKDLKEFFGSHSSDAKQKKVSKFFK